jgi:hypothetical protein
LRYEKASAPCHFSPGSFLLSYLREGRRWRGLFGHIEMLVCAVRAWLVLYSRDYASSDAIFLFDPPRALYSFSILQSAFAFYLDRSSHFLLLFESPELGFFCILEFLLYDVELAPERIKMIFLMACLCFVLFTHACFRVGFDMLLTAQCSACETCLKCITCLHHMLARDA